MIRYRLQLFKIINAIRVLILINCLKLLGSLLSFPCTDVHLPFLATRIRKRLLM